MSRMEQSTGDPWDDAEDLDLLLRESAPEEDLADVVRGMGLSPKDAFILSMRERGRVDLGYMSTRSGISEQELLRALTGVVIWPDPLEYRRTESVRESWVSREQLLSGNLYRKLAAAEELEETAFVFGESAQLLRENLPEMVEVSQIHINLGATWVPAEHVSRFVAELLDIFYTPRVEYDGFQGKWTIQCLTDPNYVKNHFTYGTSRKSAIELLKCTLNAHPVRVYDQVAKSDGSGEDSILNEAETLMAQEKQRAIQEAWREYIYRDPHTVEQLEDLYMEHYGYRVSRYDGSYLELPGLNPKIKPYRHQLDGIARIMLQPCTLLAHRVGSGKTLEYMCGIHELLRIGLGRKALIVVPNPTLAQTAAAYEELYPTSMQEVYVVYPQRDFTARKRGDALERIRREETRIILMAYSSFDMLLMSKDYEFALRDEEIRRCRMQLAQCKSRAAHNSVRSRLKTLQRRTEKYKNDFEETRMHCFDKLGVDILVVDEAHNYKNITLDNISGNNIVGVHSSGSKKSDQLLKKVDHIRGQGGHVIFATGTPITNSLADVYVLQRYLQPEEMRLNRIEHFNDWINTFCEQTTSFEVDVDASHFRIMTRFSKFHNLPELMAMFSSVSDFYQTENGELGLPDFHGYTDTVVRKSVAQKAYIEDLAKRTERIRGREVRRKDDNLLKVTGDGRKCALDVRLVLDAAHRDPSANGENKCKACARAMAEIYHGHPGTTQIAFADISTPKEGFNVYDELKKELVALGLPAQEIAYIHDAANDKQRSDIEARFNSGELRVLIGSTQKLGTGTNVQDRLLAVHHLDVPWRPADMVQREGRIVRQGNQNPEVYIYRYVTEASFDSYMWQILENKQQFIAQFLSGTLSAVHREESDCTDTVLSYAEIKALAIGNPLIRKRVETSNQLEQARSKQRSRRQELQKLRETLDLLPHRIEVQDGLIKRAGEDRYWYERSKQPVAQDERLAFGEELLSALSDNFRRDRERKFGDYQSFQVILPAFMVAEDKYILLRRRGGNEYRIKMDGDKPLGVCRRLDYFLEHLGDTIESYERRRDDLLIQQAQAQRDLDEGNEYDASVEELSGQLSRIDEELQAVTQDM